MMRRSMLLAVPAVGGGLLAGCGLSGGPAPKAPIAAAAKAPMTAANAAVAAGAGKLTVTTTEYAFAPTAITAKSGKLKITLDNQGKLPHELVVLRTDQAAAALPASGGRVSEKTSVGEVSETAAGTTKSATVTLKPGKYVFVCNIPGHYQDGMRGTLAVQ
jgi:uncharacterized cupredoxin-like copper-binding protein